MQTKNATKLINMYAFIINERAVFKKTHYAAAYAAA